MPFRYKIDIIAALKDAGYNSVRIRKEKIMNETMLQKIRHGEMVSWATLAALCAILNCQPGDLLEFVPDEPERDLSDR
ncbi:MAG: helix-turn-helix transcriptional regulator [Clostridia bacterium]|nr:helix-turn-helix transcriptional regulator [Clostridia bacterium]